LVFHTDVLCGGCFWLTACLLWFILLESNCGWQKNGLDNPVVLLEDGEFSENAGTQDSD
jgi:hypothetical protein